MTEQTPPPPPPMGPPAGWYPDPENAQQRRYWDGAAWTSHTAPENVPPPPAASVTPTPVSPSVTSKTCIVGPCSSPRVADSQYCAKHGGRKGGASARFSNNVGSSAIVCPHCQSAGQVRTKKVKKKQGISGGKATGAVLTLGVSMLATGLSRKQNFTQMKCGNCGVEWLV